MLVVVSAWDQTTASSAGFVPSPCLIKAWWHSLLGSWTRSSWALASLKNWLLCMWPQPSLAEGYSFQKKCLAHNESHLWALSAISMGNRYHWKISLNIKGQKEIQCIKTILSVKPRSTCRVIGSNTFLPLRKDNTTVPNETCPKAISAAI